MNILHLVFVLWVRFLIMEQANLHILSLALKEGRKEPRKKYYGDKKNVSYKTRVPRVRVAFQRNLLIEVSLSITHG